MSDTKGGPGSNGGESFEARLRTARQRRGLESPDGPREPSRVGGLPTSAFGIGMRVAVELASALILGVAIGWGLDHWLHTAPIFIGLFVLLGGAAGVLNVWRLIKPGQGMSSGRRD